MADVADVSGLELRSKITSGGELELWLEEVTTPELAADEVVIRVEASPINPSDLGVLLGPADLSTIRSGGTGDRPTATASIPPSRMAGVAGRLDESMLVGNEGAGVVVKAGADLQALIGRTLATRTLGMYAQYRVAKASECMVLPEGTTPKEGASAFINPLTALGMVETMRREGHTALVHTAAASNLGQMLNRVCLADGIALVNVVRNTKQAGILREIGAKHVLDSTTPTFVSDLTDALAETGATRSAAGHWPRLSCRAWRRPPAARRRPTTAMARPSTSRSTSMASSIPGRRRSITVSAWPGASGVG
jgi:NADPH:quinone reductase